MPKNKEALVRYRIINRCLIDYKYVTLKKLQDQCLEILYHEIAARTLEKDIHDMKEDAGLGYHAPIEYDKYRRAYFYDNPNYSIDNLPLDQYDLEALLFASTMLDQYKNMEIVSTFSGAVTKIIDTMKIKRMLKERPEKKFVGFEVQPVIHGNLYLPIILDAIINRKVLHILHQRFDSEEAHHHIVHPYYLKEYSNRWYMVGFQPVNRKIQTYGLERIKSMEHVKEDVFIEVPFDPDTYYRHLLGVTVSEDSPSEITIKFTNAQGKYILSQPIHDSQQLISNDEKSITIKLFLSPSYEFISMVLGWGADAEVIEPLWLREKISSKLRDALSIYK